MTPPGMATLGGQRVVACASAEERSVLGSNPVGAPSPGKASYSSGTSFFAAATRSFCACLILSAYSGSF